MYTIVDIANDNENIDKIIGFDGLIIDLQSINSLNFFMLFTTIKYIT